MRTVPLLLVALSLTGCAACREHPAVCAVTVGAVVAAGFIAAHQHHESAATGCIGYYERQGATPAEAQHACR